MSAIGEERVYQYSPWPKCICHGLTKLAKNTQLMTTRLIPYILDLRQFGVFHHMTCRVSWIWSQDHGSSTSYFLRDLLGMNVVSILLWQRGWYSSELKFDNPTLSRWFDGTIVRHSNISLIALIKCKDFKTCSDLGWRG